VNCGHRYVPFFFVRGFEDKFHNKDFGFLIFFFKLAPYVMGARVNMVELSQF